MGKLLNEAWIRRKFKAWRKRKGLTLREVEKLTGLSNPFISQFENGRSGIGFDAGIKLICVMSEPAPAGLPAKEEGKE